MRTSCLLLLLGGYLSQGCADDPAVIDGSCDCGTEVAEDAGGGMDADAAADASDAGDASSDVVDVSPDASPDAGSDTGSDVEAPPMVCNDGVLHTMEECEGFDLRNTRCEDLGFTGGRLGCADDCTFDTSGCSTCGDGVADPDEVCDGTDVRDVSCGDWLGEGATGEVTCADDCSTVLLSTCERPAPAPPLAACDPLDGAACDGGLSCVDTSVGAYCLQACETDRECDPSDQCRDQGAGQSACAPRPVEGEPCDASTGCGDGSTCVDAFGGASVCARTCLPSLAASGCDSDETCIVPPGRPFEVDDRRTCDVAGGGCDIESGWECVLGDDEVGACVRPTGVCSDGVEVYQFDGAGPADEVLCDLRGATGGGRFCAAPGDAFGYCYPLFGDDAPFGACVALCDDGTEFGRSDRDCGAGWTCTVPADTELYLPDDTPQDCSSTGAEACPDSHPECIDFGDGAVCVRPSRVCIQEAP